MTEPHPSLRPGAEGSDLLATWVLQICRARSAAAPDIAAGLGLDLVTAEHVGSQRLFAGVGAVGRCELVLDQDATTVLFAELQPRAATTVAELAASLGTGRVLPMGPHDRAPSLIFDDIWPAGSERGCTVLLRLAGPPHAPAAPDMVASVVLYLQPIRYDQAPPATPVSSAR